MSVGTDSNTGRSDRRTTLDPLGPPDSLSRHDLVLLVIPLAFPCSLALGSALPVATPTALVGAALFGAAVVADALFVDPPGAR
jgi:hypothetical protein